MDSSMAFLASSSMDMPSASWIIFSTSERSPDASGFASGAAVSFSPASAAVVGAAAGCVSLLPPPPQPASDTAVREHARTTDKKRFFI